MRPLFLFLAVVFSLNISAQEVTQDVGDFSELKVFDLIFVRLIQSNENKVVVRGEYAEDIKIINNDGTLKVRMHTNTRFRGEDTYVEVYTKNIQVIDANEGTKITVDQVLKQDKIELRVQEGGEITTALQVDFAKMKAVTGGKINVTGHAKIQEITINTGGVFEGEDLKTKDTEVVITAAGEAHIYATENADVRIRAGGEVYVHGNPSNLKKKRFAGGRIHVID